MRNWALKIIDLHKNKEDITYLRGGETQIRLYLIDELIRRFNVNDGLSYQITVVRDTKRRPDAISLDQYFREQYK